MHGALHGAVSGAQHCMADTLPSRMIFSSVPPPVLILHLHSAEHHTFA